MEGIRDKLMGISTLNNNNIYEGFKPQLLVNKPFNPDMSKDSLVLNIDIPVQNKKKGKEKPDSLIKKGWEEIIEKHPLRLFGVRACFGK